MIKETDGDRFEEMRALNQNLTFLDATKELFKRNVAFGPEQIRTLKLIDRDGLYSNLGLLLSDQCTHTIKVAVFQGTDQTTFRDRREFEGSLIKHMNDAYDFLDFHNQTHATIDKLIRVDNRDYPEVAVREALLNLIVHRDYSFSASALISIYSDRIEFISIGGLVNDIEKEDIMLGISICRNQNLANVFYHLHLIEAYGTGIRKIIREYKERRQKPVFEISKNAFKIILPNTNEQSCLHSTIPFNKNTHDQLSDKDKEVLKYAKTNGSVTRAQITSLLGVSISEDSKDSKKTYRKQSSP